MKNMETEKTDSIMKVRADHPFPRYAMRCLLAFAFALCFMVCAFSETVHVPGDYPTIQAAIDSAADYDVVLVATGTYMENIDYLGKAITVLSDSGPGFTEIDGRQLGSVVTFDNDETIDSILDGFTVTNGFSSEGGGIYCGYDASPTIRNNVISNNESGIYGGGLYVYYGDPIIEDNLFLANHSRQSGGAMTLQTSKTQLSRNTVTGNSALHNAGGIQCLGGSPVLIQNEVAENTANKIGGGVFVSSGAWLIENSILHNKATLSGGGIRCTGSTLERNSIIDNFAAQGGGILISSGSEAVITGNMIIENKATTYGGGIYADASAEMSLVNNTICRNFSGITGGGIYSYTSHVFFVINCVLWENSALYDPEIYALSGTNTLVSTLIKGGGIGLNVFDEDPLFADPDNSDFHLTRHSPCINRGVITATPPTDIDGDVRPFMGAVDLGADEFTGTHALSTDEFFVSQSVGCDLTFALDAGSEYAARDYLLLGSYSGTVPGYPLPGGQATLPLNWDGFTSSILFFLNTPLFHDFYGELDPAGQGSALMNSQGPLPPGVAGYSLHFAFCLNYPWEYVSNLIIVHIIY